MSRFLKRLTDEEIKTYEVNGANCDLYAAMMPVYIAGCMMGIGTQ